MLGGVAIAPAVSTAQADGPLDAEPESIHLLGDVGQVEPPTDQGPTGANAVDTTARESRYAESRAIVERARVLADEALAMALPQNEPSLRARFEALSLARHAEVDAVIERLWFEQIAHCVAFIDTRLDRGDLIVAQNMFDFLTLHAPNDARVIDAHRRLLIAQLAEARADGHIDRWVSRAYALRLRFGPDYDRDVIAAREARINATMTRSGQTASPEAARLVWDDMTAILRHDPEHPVQDRLGQAVDAYFDASVAVDDLSAMDAFVSVVEMWWSEVPDDHNAHLAGWANYRAATRLWQRGGAFMSRSDGSTARLYLQEAAEWGYARDPFNTRRNLRRARLLPGVFPLLILLTICGFGVYYSRARRRMAVRKDIRRAHRLWDAGSRVDAAVLYLRSLERSRQFLKMGSRDHVVVAAACERMLRDALQQGRIQEAQTWADRLADLPFEYWPDDFDELAKYCGIDPSARAQV